jgi:predicted permease
MARRFVRSVAHASAWLFPRRFRRTHRADFLDVADHLFHRASTHGVMRATIVTSRVLFMDALRMSPALWRDALGRRGGSRDRSAAQKAWLPGGGWWQDVRQAGRGALRQPGTTILLVGTIALGVSTSTTAFDALDRTILRPLPFPRPEQLSLLVLEETSEHYYTSVSADALAQWRERATSLQGVEAFVRSLAVINSGTSSHSHEAISVTGGLPALLGVRAVAGRMFTHEDGRPDGPAVAMLGESYWKTAHGGDPAIIGQAISISGTPTVVIGIWPDAGRVDFFETVDVVRLLRNGSEYNSGTWAQVVARRKPGRSSADMIGELNTMPPASAHRPGSAQHFAVTAMTPGALLLGETFTTGVWLVFGGAIVLLLASLASATSILVERAASRRHEIGIRIALGGSQARLARLFLAEGLIVAIAALAIGAGLTAILERAIAVVEPRLYRDTFGAGLAGRAFVFAAGLSGLVAMLCTLAPLARLRAARASGWLAQGHGRVSSTGTTWARALVGAQAALAVLLLVGAAIMGHSLRNLLKVNPGMDMDRLAEFSISLPAARYPTAEAAAQYFTDATAALASLPGVAGVTTSGMPMLQAALTSGLPWIDGEPKPAPPPDVNTASSNVGPEYFGVVGLRTLMGRTFTADDGPLVAVVDDTFARAHGGDVIGRQLHMPFSQAGAPPYRIVGVVNDVRFSGLANDKIRMPAVYLPVPPRAANAPVPVSRRRRFIVRTHGDPAEAIAGARAALARVDPSVPILAPNTGPEELARQTAQHRFVALLLGALAVASCTIAMAGIYGAVALHVSRGRRDIGVRMALGATAARLVRATALRALTPVLAGSFVGSVAAAALMPRIEALLFRVSPRDPLSAAGAVLAVIGVAATAAWIPARRVARLDPVRTLRES